MRRARAAEVAAVSAMAVIVTVMMAAPVLRAPSERVFGSEIVGRHHDPFTVMAQFMGPIRLGVYSQPVTDIPGTVLAWVSGPVAAYNWLILLSFPFSAAAAYLLARHLSLSKAGAVVAAMAYAFSPFHLAHAAYHPHIAQTQWLPLYLLALWRCLDAATPAALALLATATAAVTLSNFYGGLIAAVITPVAVAAYWVGIGRTDARSNSRLGVTTIGLLIMAVSGAAYAWYAARDVILDPAAFTFPRNDLFRYSAHWWSYLMPPVGQPWLGASARRLWDAAGVREGLLEQQVSLGWGIMALGLVAINGWWMRDRQAGGHWVPVLVAVAVAALLCSLPPSRATGAFTVASPSALLYGVLPMFRSYARFGVVVQLMAALLAGIGVDRLLRGGTSRTRVACIALVVLAVAEYVVPSSALSRDVLPTAAHRWVAQQADDIRVLDCTPPSPDSESIRWFTAGRVMALAGGTIDCAELNLPQLLAAQGYTHLLARRDSWAPPWLSDGAVPGGLQIAAAFSDGRVFKVTAEPPTIYTAGMQGFFRRERDAEWSWRWMGADAGWAVVNASPKPIVATLDVELSAFHRSRTLALLLDARPVETLVVEQSRRTYRVGPLTVLPGLHELRFRPAEPPTVAATVIDNSDRRPLSFALGTWQWTVADQP